MDWQNRWSGVMGGGQLDWLEQAGPASRRTRQPADGLCPGTGPVAQLLLFPGALGGGGLVRRVYRRAC